MTSALFSPQAIQIMNGLFHFALGGLLMIPMGVHVPICVAVWYPLWGGVMVSEDTMTTTETGKKKVLKRPRLFLCYEKHDDRKQII